MAELDRALEAEYRIQVFDETDEVTADDVLKLWERERVVTPAAAERRIAQVLLVATHVTDGVVGVTTAYVRRNEQLRMDLWHFRAFVVPAHRASHVTSALALQAIPVLEGRFVTGRDTSGAGIAYEVENADLERSLTQAVWMVNDTEAFAYFIGENAKGKRVSVRYFAGALAPLP